MPVRKLSGPLTCKAAAPAPTSDLLSAVTATLATPLPPAPVISTLVSCRPAPVSLFVFVSARMICAPSQDSFEIPTPTAAVVALDVLVVFALITGALPPFLTVVISALLISARAFSLFVSLSAFTPISVRATPIPNATVVLFVLSSPEPVMLVLVVLSVAFTVTEAALRISSRSHSVFAFRPNLSSPITATVLLTPRFTPKLPWTATLPSSL